MSRENVKIVRGHVGPYDGQDLVIALRDAYEGVDLGDPGDVAAAVATMIREDPVWRQVDSAIVWDATGLGVSPVAHGINDVGAYWLEWAGLWASYVYRVVEFRDHGDWVLTVTDVHARGRDGIDLALRSFQAWEVRDGKIATMRGYTSEAAALAAIEAALETAGPER